MTEPLQYIDELALFTEADFKKAYLLDFQPGREDLALEELARQYHERCDAYDRSVCTGFDPTSNEVIPANCRERRAVYRNALLVRADIIEQARAQGMNGEHVRRAITIEGST